MVLVKMAPSSFVCFVLAVLIISCVEARSKVHRGEKCQPKTPSSNTSHNIPPDQWFTQLLDHFDLTNNKTWLQKYQVVTDYYKEGGPVFLDIGGEGELFSEWMVNGSWIDYAKIYNAFLIQLEHRYYGGSHPTSDVSLENLRYLNSEQALADIANFVTGINDIYNLTSETKWIAFGGSYAGNLAAWVRFKYPHLIHGAITASAPLLAKVNFNEFVDVVKNSLATYGTNCTDVVESANKEIKALLENSSGRSKVEKMFKLCEPIDANNQNDVYSLFQTLFVKLSNLVMYNKDNSFILPRNFTIDTICAIMTDTSVGNVVERYAAMNTFFMNFFGQTCIDIKYDKDVERMRNTSWDGDGALSGARQWAYQSCTEFGYFKTSESPKQLFGPYLPLSLYLKQCSDIFGDGFNSDMVYNGVRRTNLKYGGLDLKATRVFYYNGIIDPWYPLGLTSTRISESPVFFINGASHNAIAYPPTSSDLPALTAARKKIVYLIGKWLHERD